jgi:hypothetical protein
MAFITSIDSVIELGLILERSEDPLLRQFHRTRGDIEWVTY